MRGEKKHIDKKGQKADDEVQNADDEQDEEVLGGTRRGMEMGDNGEGEHDQADGGGDRVNNEDVGERRSGGGGKIESGRVIGTE
jgi:hypothetical protein